ncbi:3985_t:CDS:2, partial [Dentiscutata erythropus]
TVNIRWNTKKIPRGVKKTDRVSVRIWCGRSQFPAKAVISVSTPMLYGSYSVNYILTLSHHRYPLWMERKVDLGDDPALVRTSCQAGVFDATKGNERIFKKLHIN